MATTWYMAFTVLNEPEFTRERLASFIENHTALRHVRVSGPSLARDVDCFLRTYVPPVRGKGVSFEDSLECPLVELGLIQSVSASDGYRFVIGPKPSLPTAVFGFALAAYLKERSSEGSATTAVEECLYGPGSPGQAFKLDENSFVQLVEGLSDLGKGVIGLSDTAGVRRIYHSQVMDPVTMLAGQYEGRGVIAI